MSVGPCYLSDEFECCQTKYDATRSVDLDTISESVRVYVHAPHNMNVAKGWNMHLLREMIEMYERSIVHCGNGKSGGTILDTARYLSKMPMRKKHRLYIENAAGQGNDLGATWEEFRKLYEKLDSKYVDVCIDTQHSFASGLCNFSKPKQILRLFDTAEDEIGGIQLIHLNDSMVEYGECKDRHETLGEGFIWSRSKRGLRCVLKACSDRNIDMIPETKTTLDDVRYCMKIMKSRKYRDR